MTRKIPLVIAMLLALTAQVIAQTIRGKVIDANNSEPLAGVSVTLKGSTGTMTNADGEYSLNISSSATNTGTLVFSFVGFTTQEITINNRSIINVSLEENVASLEEFVVTALGVEREQRKIGYGVSTIKAADIVKAAPTNLAAALYGKAPGVSINSNPGGATSAVAIDIRGLNSTSNPRQPLLVVDGVISRNGEANNNGFWDSPRIQGNGMLDVHPENIENITILKGAAATALYGSEAGSGAIVITTKSGKNAKGFGVDLNSSFGIETVAIVPKYQSAFGPGSNKASNLATTGNHEGWLTINVNGKTYQRPWLNTWQHFGPQYDGREIYYFDGSIRKYEPYKNNWENFYKTGYSSVQNIALYNATEKFNYRFSYARNDYSGVMEGGNQAKNTFNLNSGLQISKKLKFDLVANYMEEKVHNRPWQIDRITNNYSGFLSPSIDMETLKRLYKTSDGYKYVTFGDSQRNPGEAFKYNMNGLDILEYFWTQKERDYRETTNRLMASVTGTYNVLDNLSLRGRIGTDYTGFQDENKEPNVYSTIWGPSGYYSTSFNRYSYLYGDLLATYNTKLTKDLGLNVQVGYQATKKEMRYSSQETDGGLAQENWFSFNNSNNQPKGRSTRAFDIKDGVFGIVGLDINNYLFLEGSLRQERTSTLKKGNNVFYYPSVSASFELSNAFTLPSAISYSKLRASYGEVGNPPGNYQANNIYNTQVINGAMSYYYEGAVGNDLLKNERKKEVEIGLENKFLNNRLGFDFTFYQNNILDQINKLSIPASLGASSIIYNVGEMRNRGVEMVFSATPVKSKDFSWNTKINLAFNKNKILSLNEALNLTELVHNNIDNGSLYVKSIPGSAAYDIYGYTLTRHANGKLLVGEDGFYVPDFTSENALKKLGNLQPKSVGGFINDIQYKNFNLNLVVDYKWGAQVTSNTLQFARSAGLLEETLFGRNTEYGGLSYYTDKNGQNIQVQTGTTLGPNGEKVFDDGMIMDGVDVNGNVNTKVVDAATYYLYSNYWGAYPGSGLVGTYEKAVYDNNFIKMREVALTYNLPHSIARSIKAQNLSITAFGRNLFYFYKSLPHLDPEAGVGTNYVSRAAVGGSGAASRSYGLTLRMTF